MSPYLRSIFIVSAVLLLLNGTCIAASSSNESLPETDAATLHSMRDSVQHNVRKILVLLKQLETVPDTQRTRLRVTASGVSIHDAQNLSATVIVNTRYGDEFDVLQHVDDWYKVQLSDGRVGWIRATGIELFSEMVKASHTFDTQSELLFVEEIRELRELVMRNSDSARHTIERLRIKVSQLPSSELTVNRPFLATAEQEYKTLFEFSEYSRQFAQKYENRLSASSVVTGTSRLQFPGAVFGQAGVQLGTSAYNTTLGDEGRVSSTASLLLLDGGMKLSSDALATLRLQHQTTVQQTPYSSTDLRLGYDDALTKQMSIKTFALFGAYRDELSPRNNYNRYGLGGNMNTALTPSTLLDADLLYDGRSYSDAAGGGYQGVQLYSHVKMSADPAVQWIAGVNAALQDSKVSYLKYTRLNPLLQYLSVEGKSRFSSKAELEILSYGSDASANDYMREQLDARWNAPSIEYQLSFIAKQFSFDALQNYLRLQARINTSFRDADKSSSASYYAVLNYYVKDASKQPQFVDVRYDASRQDKMMTLDWSLFGRFWYDPKDTTDRDHSIDAYLRLGFNFNGVNIGPLLGTHLLIRTGQKVLWRDGNGLRTGLDARGSFSIEKAQINASVRYERDFVYGRQITIDRSTGVTQQADVVELHPVTFQYTLNATYPILQSLDISLSINQYDIRPDVNNDVSIDPVERRKQFNALVGANYRFDTR